MSDREKRESVLSLRQSGSLPDLYFLRVRDKSGRIREASIDFGGRGGAGHAVFVEVAS